MTEAALLRLDAERSRRLAETTVQPAMRGALETMAREYDRDADRLERADRVETARTPRA